MPRPNSFLSGKTCFPLCRGLVGSQGWFGVAIPTELPRSWISNCTLHEWSHGTDSDNVSCNGMLGKKFISTAVIMKIHSDRHVGVCLRVSGRPLWGTGGLDGVECS
jgi:hypothetical protein